MLDLNVFFLTGHTASGKTDFVFSLFEELIFKKKQRTFIINSDAYQIYKDITLISTQPNFKEFFAQKQQIRELFQNEKELKKYFLLYDYLAINQRFSVFEMINLIKMKISECINNENAENIIITGGSPMYMRLLVDGLNGVNKESFEEFLKKNFPKINFNLKKNILFKTREILYQNCEKRVDLLIQNGVLDEVKLYLEKIKNFPDYQSLTSYQTLGIKEIERYFLNEISFDEMSYQIKKKTRNYIKHQDTWFRNKFKDFSKLELFQV